MFFIDKYCPKTIEDAYFHKNDLLKLATMSKDDSLPHIIFYGPDGCGKKTIIKLFLEMIYDEHVHKLNDSIYMVTGSGNSTTEVAIKQSNYHIVIEPNNNNFDRYLIQDVVKEYAKRIPLGVFTAKKIFKTVLINNVDNLSYYAQTSLRRTMEKFSGTCRFIMWSRSLSKVIDPLKSRSYCFRIKAPQDHELLNFIYDIAVNENIKTSFKKVNRMLSLANGNIKKVLWLLELSKLDDTFETSYETIIKEIIDLILSNDLKQLLEIRELLYKIMITNISGTQIIKDITDQLITKNILNKNKIDIVEMASIFEHNLIRGRREIKHLETFITSVMYINKN